MTKELREQIKRECENMPKEMLKNLCRTLFETNCNIMIKENEQTFKYLNSLWCICDNAFIRKYNEEY